MLSLSLTPLIALVLQAGSAPDGGAHEPIDLRTVIESFCHDPMGDARHRLDWTLRDELEFNDEEPDLEGLIGLVGQEAPGHRWLPSLVAAQGARLSDRGAYAQAQRFLEASLTMMSCAGPDAVDVVPRAAFAPSFVESMWVGGGMTRSQSSRPKDVPVAGGRVLIVIELAFVHAAQGRHEAAVDLLSGLLAGLPPGTIEHAGATNNLSHSLAQLGRLAEARALLQSALASVGPADPGPGINPNSWLGQAAEQELLARYAPMRTNLASLLLRDGRLDEAIEVLEPVLSIRMNQPDMTRLDPSAERDLARSLNNMGAALLLRAGPGDGEAALAYFEQAEAAFPRALRASHPDFAGIQSNRARALRAVGRLEEAREAFLIVLERRLALLPEGHPDIARTVLDLSRLDLSLGRNAEALAFARRGAEISEAWRIAELGEDRTGPGRVAGLTQADFQFQRLEAAWRIASTADASGVVGAGALQSAADPG